MLEKLCKERLLEIGWKSIKTFLFWNEYMLNSIQLYNSCLIETGIRIENSMTNYYKEWFINEGMNCLVYFEYT